MIAPSGKSVETEGVIGKCKDFLCPPEHFIREIFPTIFEAKLRAKALDPYGTMANGKLYGKTEGYWTCAHENCHAKLMMRLVKPDSEGNTIGLFGCFSHQHEMPQQTRAKIVFRNRQECQEFYDKNFYVLYGKGQNMVKKNMDCIYFPCRRRNLGPNYGYVDCTSTFTMIPAFRGNPKELESVPINERPWCLSGVFYHNHENDERFHRLDGTGAPNKIYKRVNSVDISPKKKKERKNYYVSKKKRQELGLESNLKSNFLKVSGKTRKISKKSKNKIAFVPISSELEMMQAKEDVEMLEKDLRLDTNVKIIKIRVNN